jgi:hypothetical protein
VTRPWPSNRCSTCAATALFGLNPLVKAPLWQQSSTRTIVRARLCCITSLTNESSTPVDRSHFRIVLDVAK